MGGGGGGGDGGDGGGGGGNPIHGIVDFLNQLRDGANSLLDGLTSGLTSIVDFAKENAYYSSKGGMNSVLAQKTMESMGPLGPYLAMTMSAMVGRGIEQMEQAMFMRGKSPEVNNAMAGAIRMGGGMMKASMEATFQMAHVSFYTTMISKLAGAGTSFFLGEDAAKTITGIGQLVNGVVDMVTIFYVSFALIFFMGGLLLYVALPLTFVLNFAAAGLRWLGLVFVSILAAPIFCFNLIRSDGEGMIGRGERFLIDLGRTALIPVILTMGAVVFMILFNIGFMLLISILNIFMQVIIKVYSHEWLLPIFFGVMLLVIAMCLLYMANVLANLCTHELIDGVGNALGEALTRGGHENPMHEIKQGVHGAGQNVAGVLKGRVGSGNQGKGDAGGQQH